MLKDAEIQINECLNLLKDIFKSDLIHVYLFGSSILGGLQKYSDIDLFVVSRRATTDDEKAKLAAELLKISGIYMKSSKRSIEMTIVEQAKINPWRYPPTFDFQYGEWLRQHFESGNINPWLTKLMTDLALLITQILLASKTLQGNNPDQVFCKVPYIDFMMASTDVLPSLLSDLASDTRNVLLTVARIWCTVTTDTICSKSVAAEWAISHLPKKYRCVMERAKTIYNGEAKEYWGDMNELIKPCADFIIDQINNKVIEIKLSNNITKYIKLIF